MTGLPCTASTDDSKPKAVASITTNGALPAEEFEYDCNGSMITRTSTLSGQSTTSAYAYDDNNRLTATSVGTPIQWTNLTNMYVNSSTGDLVADWGLPGTAYSAGASSVEQLTGDGAISFRFRTSTTPRQLVGLNDTDVGTGYGELDYSIYASPSNRIYIYESGAKKCNTTAQCEFFIGIDDSDTFAIKRHGSEIRYLRNGQVFYKSSVSASGSYHVDSSFIYSNTRIGEVTINNVDSGISRNVYDANGQRVLRVDPNGTKTIYLGATELRWTPGNSTIDVARTYPGGTRRGFDGTITYTIGNHQGTPTATINANTGTHSPVRYLPYGGLRDGTVIDDKGFLNQTTDTAQGLTYLNNRHYDPTTGVFISVDPLVTNTGEPYIYGAANPITFSDPDGLDPDTASWVRHRAEDEAGDHPSPSGSGAKSTNNGCTYSSSRWGCDTRADENGPEYLPYVPPPGWEYRPYDVAASGGFFDGFFEGCDWVCATATGVTALVSYSVAGGICAGTLGVACGAAVLGATGVTSVVYEATSTDADGGDLVCAFFVGPSNGAASAGALVSSGGLTGATQGGAKIAGNVLQNVFTGRVGGALC